MTNESNLIEWLEKPEASEIYMIAGWRQWADGGSVSSGLPEYLAETLGARKIGHIKSDGFYLFQTPVSQFLFRPQVKFEQGYRQSMTGPRNDIYYWNDGEKGLVIFVGDEPHMNVERYAEAFFEIATTLKVKRVAATGGVYAIVPYDKDRSFTCTYSLPGMKAELNDYAVGFSDYEGGVSIGSYLNDRAEAVGVEYFSMYAFVPIYDFSRVNPKAENITIENDYKAWYDVMLRLNHMFKLGIDLSELAERSQKLIETVRTQIEDMAQATPNFPIKEYVEKLTADFVEQPFAKLDDVWHDALGDLFKDGE